MTKQVVNIAMFWIKYLEYKNKQCNRDLKKEMIEER